MYVQADQWLNVKEQTVRPFTSILKYRKLGSNFQILNLRANHVDFGTHNFWGIQGC